MIKKLPLVLLCHLFFGICYISNAQYTTILDNNFEAALAVYDDILNDNQVPTANISSLTTLNISNSNISDLTGIEDFIALESLEINDNNLASINVSNLANLITLRVTRNQLTTLDLSNQSALQTLIADNNDIESLQINSTALRYLQLFSNELTEIDLTTFPLLEQVFLGQNNLTNLNVSMNPSLFRVEFQHNDIKLIDVSALTGLRFLIGRNNELEFANVKNGNNTAIEDLQLQNNANLSCIEVDNATAANTGAGNYAAWQIDAATSAYADQCLTNVPDDNFEQALIDAGYDSGALDNFVPTANIAVIERMDAGTGGLLYNKGITDLTGIEDFTSLIQLWSEGNPIESIDVSKNINIEILTFINSELGSLDLTANTKLKNVAIGNSPLATINVTNNTMMTRIVIWNTIVSSIDLSANTAMTNLSISDSPLGTIDLSTNVALERLSFDNTQLTSLDIGNNTLLTDLELDTNPITSLDLTTNTALTSLSIENNQFTRIDLSTNILLTDLECSNSQLTNLDLSTNTELVELYCNNNALTSLDLSANTLLEELEANNNQLALLNVKNGTNQSNLSYLSAIDNSNLSCIEVDDATAAAAETGNYSNWDKDATSSYSELCRTCEIDDDFTILTYSETCTDKNNGKISINANENTTYIATINNESQTFTTTTEITNLEPGTHNLCIAIDGFEDCKQCYDVVIPEATIVAGKTTIQKNREQVLVTLESGTPPYKVSINNKQVSTYDINTFLVAVHPGDVIDISSSITCEGKLTSKVAIENIGKAYPNPTQSDIEIILSNPQSTINVDMYNALGIVVSSNNYTVSGNRLVIPMKHLPNGIYFLYLDKAFSSPFKIVKQ
ncbi:T9SS type A sorting domain-containing protein [Aquimarina sp. 2201CG1-2-11]|uniref:T9SS type A sorting domain-containing protein n=1 Tax=Aquimarina discodermiae TaxID=3231043 RepID=UPI003463243A